MSEELLRKSQIESDIRKLIELQPNRELKIRIDDGVWEIEAHDGTYCGYGDSFISAFAHSALEKDLPFLYQFPIPQTVYCVFGDNDCCACDGGGLRLLHLFTMQSAAQEKCDELNRVDPPHDVGHAMSIQYEVQEWPIDTDLADSNDVR